MKKFTRSKFNVQARSSRRLYCLLALLVLSVVAGDSAVCRFGLDGLAGQMEAILLRQQQQAREHVVDHLCMRLTFLIGKSHLYAIRPNLSILKTRSGMDLHTTFRINSLHKLRNFSVFKYK